MPPVVNAALRDGRFHAAFAALLAEEEADLGDATDPFADHFVDWLIAHRLAPYASTFAAGLAPRARERLQAEATMAAAQAVVRERELRRLFGALAARGVVPILFKGLGVAYRYYASPDHRPLGDVDLLVDAADLEPAVAAAEDAGCTQAAVDPAVRDYYRVAGYNVPLRHPLLGLLELHHSLYRDCEAPFVDDVRARARPTELFGQPARMLAPADLFVVLACHLCVSDPGLRWLWLLDLVLMARRLSPAEWRAIAALSVRHGLQLYTAAALSMLAELWGVSAPSEISASLSDALGWTERRALEATWQRLRRTGLGGDLLMVGRRFARRPVRGGLSALVGLGSHPGAVCLDLGVASGSRLFPVHRLRHFARRMLRAGRALAARVP